MDPGAVGRVLLVAGVVAVVAGAVMLAFGGLGWRRLPGDLQFGRGNVRVFVPLATCIVLSLVATVVLNLLLRR